MGMLSKKNGGFMDQIRCDEPNYLIWKWHPAGSEAGNNKRENAIRWGSSLRVKNGETAVFFYSQGDGTNQEIITGPFDDILSTANLPILASIIGLAYDGGTPFQAEVYFINNAQINQVKFGVPFFDVYDPRFDDFGVPVAVRGTISFAIRDTQEFINLHRLQTFTPSDFQGQIRDAVVRYVKDTVANAPAAHSIPVVQIESKTAQINDAIELDVKNRLSEDFGVMVSGVDISTIEIDKTSDGYLQLMAVTKNVTTSTVQAQTEANVKDIHDKQRIESQDYEEELRIRREEEQYAKHKQTQTANLSAFQIESQTQVGIAGAEALGKMGSNNAGSVDLGGGTGFNPATMMAGMALGGAVGQNIAGTMNSIMSGVNQETSSATPPPIPVSGYHVAVNGQSTGPFDLSTLGNMAVNGTFTKDSLVWKQGMSDWVAAGTIQELQAVLNNIMPPIPTEE